MQEQDKPRRAALTVTVLAAIVAIVAAVGAGASTGGSDTASGAQEWRTTPVQQGYGQEQAPAPEDGQARPDREDCPEKDGSGGGGGDAGFGPGGGDAAPPPEGASPTAPTPAPDV